MNSDYNDINDNSNSKFDEQKLKDTFVDINTTFGQYIESLFKDVDKNPDIMEETYKHSEKLISYYKHFIDHINSITEEVAENKNFNNNNKDLNQDEELLNRPETIVIDHCVIEQIKNSIIEQNNKLKKINRENTQYIQKHQRNFINFALEFKKDLEPKQK